MTSIKGINRKKGKACDTMQDQPSQQSYTTVLHNIKILTLSDNILIYCTGSNI